MPQCHIRASRGTKCVLRLASGPHIYCFTGAQFLLVSTSLNLMQLYKGSIEAAEAECISTLRFLVLALSCMSTIITCTNDYHKLSLDLGLFERRPHFIADHLKHIQFSLIMIFLLSLFLGELRVLATHPNICTP